MRLLNIPDNALCGPLGGKKRHLSKWFGFHLARFYAFDLSDRTRTDGTLWVGWYWAGQCVRLWPVNKAARYERSHARLEEKMERRALLDTKHALMCKASNDRLHCPCWVASGRCCACAKTLTHEVTNTFSEYAAVDAAEMERFYRVAGRN